jgi:hypothetical protein
MSETVKKRKRKGGMRPTTRWTNFGVWLELGSSAPSAGVKTPWGNLIIKRRDDVLFGERYGYMPTAAVGSMRLSWVRLRKWTPTPPKADRP